MNKQKKKQILASLKIAYENTCEEQDIHRAKIAAMENSNNKGYLQKLVSLGWDGLVKAMAGESAPATHEDRSRYLDQTFDCMPSKTQLDQIEDRDIRASTYFLGEVVDQCQRIKASAKFLEILCCHPGDQHVGMFFRLWSMHNVWSQLAKEQLALGDEEQVGSLLQLIDATEKAFDLLAKNPGQTGKNPLA